MPDKVFSKVPDITSGNFRDVHDEFWVERSKSGPNSNDVYVANKIAEKYNFDPEKFMAQMYENQKREEAYKDAVENKGLTPSGANAGKFSSTLVDDNASLWEKYNPARVVPQTIITAIGSAKHQIGDLFTRLADEAYPPLSGDKGSLPGGQKIANIISETSDKVNNFLHTNEYTKPIVDSAAGRAFKSTIDPVIPAGVETAADVANYIFVGGKLQKVLPTVKAIPKLIKNVVGGVVSFIGADLLIGDKEETFTPSLIPKWMEDNPTLGPIVIALAEQTTIKETDSNYQKLVTKIKDGGVVGVAFNIALRTAINVVKGVRGLRNKAKAIDEKILEPEKIIKNKNVKEIKVKKDKDGEFGWEINTTEPITLLTDKKIAQPTSMFKRWFTSRQGLDSKTYRAFEQLEGKPKALAIDLKIQNKNFTEAIENSYGQSLEKLDDATIALINKALGDAPAVGRDAPELIQKILKKNKKKLTKKDKDILTEYYDSIAKKSLAERDKALQLLPKPLRKEVIKMRIDVDKYTDDILKTGITGKSASATLDRNKGLYITTDYKMFSTPKWAIDIIKTLEGKGAKGSEAYTAVMEAKLLLKQSLPKGTSNKEIENMLHDYVESMGKGQEGILDMLLLSKSTAMQTSKKYGKILNNRKNIDEAFFKILGRENNPLVRYNNTLKNMSGIIAEHQFLSTIKGIANSQYGSKLFITGAKDLEKGFSGDISNLASNYIRQAGAEANPVANIFTSKLYKKYLTEGIELAKSNPNWSSYYALNGLVNSNVTTLSATTHSKNFMGNWFFLAMNGNLGPSVFKNIKPLMQNLLKSKGKDIDMMKFFAANGLTNSGVRAQTIIRSLDEAVNNPNGWYAKATKPLDYAASLYSLEDDVFKILSFFKEKARYKRALPKASESELNLLAVEVVKDTMPTYHKLIRPVKYLRRTPFGTFPAFTHEVFRASVGTVRRGVLDLNLGIRTGNKGLIQAGMARIAGVTTASTGAIAHLQYERMRHNITRDDIVAIDSVSQDWQKNDIVDYDSNIHINSRGDLEVKIKNLTSVLPHAPIIQVVQQVYPYIMSKQGKEDLANGNLDNFDKIISALQAATAVFTNESLLAAAFMDVYRGETKKGKSLYNIQDDWFDRRKKDAARILKPIVPGAGTIKTGIGVYDAYRSEKINNARNEGYGITESGWNAKAIDKLKSIPGVKYDAINISKSFQSAVKAKAAAISAANSNITRVLNNSFNIDWTNEKEVQKVIQDFKDRIQYSHEQQVNLADMFDDFKQLKYYKGTNPYQVDDEFILDLLADSGVNKVNKKLYDAFDQDILTNNIGFFNSPNLEEAFDNLRKNQGVPMQVLLHFQNILTQAQGTPLIEIIKEED